MTYEEGTAVLVRYPRTRAEEKGDRSAWPWMPGYVEETCGDDEWMVVVESRDVATLADGTPAPAGTPDEDVCYSVCYRDSSELKAVSE